MHIAPSIYAVACLLPTVAAFYPYKPNDSPDNPNTNTPRSSSYEPNTRALTLPLRRGPTRRGSTRRSTRRGNNYKIVNSKAPTQKNSAAIDQDGPDFSYMVGIKLGESEEEYHILLDTAASNTWVMGEGCKTLACGTHNTFGTSDSSSLKVSHFPLPKSSLIISYSMLKCITDGLNVLQYRVRHRHRLRQHRHRRPPYCGSIPYSLLRPRNQCLRRIPCLPHGRNLRTRARRHKGQYHRGALPSRCPRFLQTHRKEIIWRPLEQRSRWLG